MCCNLCVLSVHKAKVFHIGGCVSPFFIFKNVYFICLVVLTASTAIGDFTVQPSIIARPKSRCWLEVAQSCCYFEVITCMIQPSLQAPELRRHFSAEGHWMALQSSCRAATSASRSVRRWKAS